MLPLNIRVDMNCPPTWVTQNAIPRELELISLGGGHYDPPPDKVGLSKVLVQCCKIDPINYNKKLSFDF